MTNVLQQQKKFWNHMSGEYDKPPSGFPPLEVFCKHVKKTSPILQYGCGRAITLNTIFNLGYKNIYGVDHSEKMIGRAKKDYPHLSANLSICDSLEVPFPEKSFDAVILNNVLTCVIRNEDQLSLINKISQVLNPEGILCICDFFIHPDYNEVLRYKMYQQEHRGEPFGIFQSSGGILFRHHEPDWVLKLTDPFEQMELKEIKVKTLSNRKTNGFYFFGKKK